MIKVRICSEHKYDIILGKGKKPLKSAYELASLPYMPHHAVFKKSATTPLTSTLDPLSLQRKVASLSLFYRYYFGHCSDELAACIPPPMARPRSIRQATFAHNYCVELSNARINRFSDGFIPSTSHLWNSLPSSVFPASFNLPSFKRQAYHHLRDQMA